MDLEARLEQAVTIAREAGKHVRRAREEASFDRDYKHGNELVTDADIATDRYISEQLEQQFPGEPRLTEELSPGRQSLTDEGPLWIVDPIDGTVNFAHGHVHVAVSIAWVEDGRIRLGVVHAPFMNETFTAIRGRGAWLNGSPIHCSETTRLPEALVATGFPYDRDARTPLMRRLHAVLLNCRDIRRNGAAALDLCHVGCGRLDAYYESSSPWDFAAGRLIAAEAGARLGNVYPCPDGIPAELYGENLVAASPALHDPLCQLIERADNGRLEG
ncbi:myo-inositol-1(or 4)-monophosphatase [Kushneria sinocarnis]|uniref:Inositol-1-monophosphatase n=1 Tax=Kushneria sinocarnis TaxID=595502 RepID=A0A420WY84_9GAMM|nr:inositol monophosphatase family protein [Kushneria sinocarnis]RKR06148.1 myo-inositol-1(or 4)-monophosphatase [Kushneria sinocarnis]